MGKLTEQIRADMTEAMKLAGAMSARQENSVVWVLSDGAFPSLKDRVEPLSSEVRFVPLGDELENQGQRHRERHQRHPQEEPRGVQRRVDDPFRGAGAVHPQGEGEYKSNEHQRQRQEQP